MKFFVNKWPDDNTFNPDESWTAMKESTNMWIVQLQAIPFIILNILIIRGVFLLFNIKYDTSLLYFLIGTFVMVPIHEVIHAWFFPEGLSSENVKFGLFPKQLVFFAFYTKEMSRNRFAATLIAPFVIITLAGVLWLVLLGDSLLVKNIVIINAMGACGDMLGLWKLMAQVPSKAIVRNKEIRTYWKIPLSNPSDAL